jgi:hypothetical protein
MLPTLDVNETRGILGSLQKPNTNSIEFHKQVNQNKMNVDATL